ncbi:hypothetical protein E2C01_074157 [Portunus trituberculatus]|uniref:Uncharacterized protein n=1 Tax=Portunus trituberculatus TaxID=210409 RepID=A0A5B7I2N7_PORTR|nr:hypothetical protein [Portunus trituberculatus]
MCGECRPWWACRGPPIRVLSPLERSSRRTPVS